MRTHSFVLDIVALGVCIYIAIVVVGTATNPTYQRGLSERYSEQQRTKRVQEEQWGDTLRTWGMWGAGALGVIAVAGAGGWAIVRWQEERTRRNEVTQVQTTQRVLIGAQRDVALAWITQFYPGAARLPKAQRPYAGILDGVAGVFVPELGEFIPEYTARRELAQARLLTVDSEYSEGGRQ